jgi:hypothetical protein
VREFGIRVSVRKRKAEIERCAHFFHDHGGGLVVDGVRRIRSTTNSHGTRLG